MIAFHTIFPGEYLEVLLDPKEKQEERHNPRGSNGMKIEESEKGHKESQVWWQLRNKGMKGGKVMCACAHMHRCSVLNTGKLALSDGSAINSLCEIYVLLSLVKSKS